MNEKIVNHSQGFIAFVFQVIMIMTRGRGHLIDIKIQVNYLNITTIQMNITTTQTSTRTLTKNLMLSEVQPCKSY